MITEVRKEDGARRPSRKRGERSATQPDLQCELLSPQPEGHYGPFFMSSALSWTLQPELMFLKAIKFELLCSLCISKIAFLSTIYQAQILICLHCFLELNINFPPASSALPGWNVFDSKAFVTPCFLQKFLYVGLESHLGVLSTA